jgi:hypothetical protein
MLPLPLNQRIKKHLKSILIFTVLFFISQLGHTQVGINTIVPQSTLDINGNLSVKVVALNGGPSGSWTTINDGIYVSLIPSGLNVEFALPDPTTVPGRMYYIRNITDFDTAQLFTQGGKLLFPKDAKTGVNPLLMPPNAQNKSVIVVSDGSNWTYYN